MTHLLMLVMVMELVKMTEWIGLSSNQAHMPHNQINQPSLHRELLTTLTTLPCLAMTGTCWMVGLLTGTVVVASLRAWIAGPVYSDQNLSEANNDLAAALRLACLATVVLAPVVVGWVGSLGHNYHLHTYSYHHQFSVAGLRKFWCFPPPGCQPWRGRAGMVL